MKCDFKPSRPAGKTKTLNPKVQEQVDVKPLHLSEGHLMRYDRIKNAAPPGFQFVLEKIVRAVLLGRPIHVDRFIADFLDAELSRHTFNDVMYGCMLKKSLGSTAYPTESCMILGLTSMVMRDAKGVAAGVGAFATGPIVECELDAPALDRYRELAVPEDFDFNEDSTGGGQFDGGAVPEYPVEPPALDRYRELSGIEDFVADDVGDIDSDSHMQLLDIGTHHPTMPNCACTFCMLQAATARSRSPKNVHGTGASGTVDNFSFEPGSIQNEFLDAFTDGPMPTLRILHPAEDRYRKYVGEFIPEEFVSDQDGHYEAMFMQQGWHSMIEALPECPTIGSQLSDLSQASHISQVSHAASRAQACALVTAATSGGGALGAISNVVGTAVIPTIGSHDPAVAGIGENLTIYGEPPTYAEPSFNNERLFKEPNDAVDEPFGQTFAHDQHFEDKIFEPEYSLGEKTFMQEHPLFGDFSRHDEITVDLAENPVMVEK